MALDQSYEADGPSSGVVVVVVVVVVVYDGSESNRVGDITLFPQVLPGLNQLFLQEK